MDGTGKAPDGIKVALDMRTDIPHVARMYDYWLGGKDNFAADRETAELALGLLPEMVDYARANRQFLVRAARFLAAAGIRQFLDIGAGMPTSPNVHEVAQQADPAARVVYVDNDPMVYGHVRALLSDSGRTAGVLADLRDADSVIGQAGELIDFGAPVALMFVACLHHVRDDDDPAGVVARYLDAVAPGSYLVLSHVTDEFCYQRMHQASKQASDMGGNFIPRGKDAILRMFNGRELLDPGLVLVSRWRPGNQEADPSADRAVAYGAISAL